MSPTFLREDAKAAETRDDSRFALSAFSCEMVWMDWVPE
jgi:hypothetical protein